MEEKSSKASWTQALIHAFCETTRLHGPEQTVSPDLVRKSLYFQPLTGLFIGTLAALFPLAILRSLESLQGFVLLSSVFYLFFLEWLTRFSGFRDFCSCCHAFSLYKKPIPERLAALDAENGISPAAAGCTALLIFGKGLALYLIFLREAVMGHTMFIVLTMLFIPFFSRIVMLYVPAKYPDMNSKLPMSVPVFWTLLLLIAGAFFTGTMNLFGDFISFKSVEMTRLNFSRIMQAFQQNTDLLNSVLVRGFRDFMFPVAAGFLTCIYWLTESSKKLETIHPRIMEAVRETAEFAALAAILILADNRIF